MIERGLDTGLPLAGPGAPLISDFAVMELSALLGRSLDSGRNYVGQVIELAHRLPRLWARLLDGEVPVWKALRIADHTRLLPAEAAAFVDRQLAPYAHGCSWAQVDRLVEEALVRFDPEAAEERRREAHEHRHVDLGLDQVGYDGIAHGTTALDIADALDLEQAIARRAKLAGQLGDDDSLDVRRAKALGEIAREDLILDLQVADPETGEITRTIPGRKTELILHMSATDQTVGRFGNTRTPISVEQIKTWLSLANTSRDRPAGDRPRGHQPVDSYEIPDRIARQVKLRDHHCVFPHCTRPAERCDLDHIDAHADGGVTCPCNLAPLCRGHHRLKTAGRAPTGCSPPAPTTGPSRRGPTWSTPPAPTNSPGHTARPARGVATQPHTPPHRRGYRHVQRWFRGSSLRSSHLNHRLGPHPPADRDHPSSLSRPQPQRAPQATLHPGRAAGTAP